jgi:oligopeptide transport system permease protein
MVGLVATIVSLLIGVSYGAFSGYAGGRVDNLMMRIVDVMYSVPFIFVVIFIITIMRSHQQTFENLGIDRRVVFFAVIGAVYWLTMARVVRGQVLSLKRKEFIEASQVLGAGTGRILSRHLIPNVFSIVLVYLTLTIPRVMLFEAFLSFLGLGVEAPGRVLGAPRQRRYRGHQRPARLLVVRPLPGPGAGRDALCAELPRRWTARRARPASRGEVSGS